MYIKTNILREISFTLLLMCTYSKKNVYESVCVGFKFLCEIYNQSYNYTV